MEIQITEAMTAQAVEAEFEAAFPFLRLAFFEHPHRSMAGDASFLITYGDRLLAVRHEVTIDSATRVGDVERRLRHRFGMHVRVLRRQGARYCPADGDELDLTLEDENARGGAAGRELWVA
jgi:hypothetical protein